MYVRPQNYRYPEGLRPPKNYSGNTFREPALTEEEPSEPEKKPLTDTDFTEQGSEEDTAALLSPKGSLFGGLFGGKGIGSEELLIFALILLLSDSNNNDDLIIFLILLFFIK